MFNLGLGFYAAFFVQSLGSHRSTLTGAMMARLSALLTMLGIVFGTLITARFANISAYSADVLGVFTPLGHEGSCQAANLRALAIQTDTLSHHFHIIFLQAGSSARITINGADITRFNTRLIFFKFHLSTLLVKKREHGWPFARQALQAVR
ncbi:hypothetical protein [Vreelandella maris]|uniref:hypothetical protein n=1 Tax=Vreelandella maris TaxID=2729617 RepID=UPI003BF50B7F